MKLKIKRLSAIAVITLLAMTAFTAPAHAHGTKDFKGSGSCSGQDFYAYSTYSYTNDRSSALTMSLSMKNNCKRVGVAIRFYTNPGAWKYSNATVTQYDSRISYGGWHDGGGERVTT